MTDNILTQLAQPFEPSAISWKPGSTTKDNSKCMALAYADLRAYMERLDTVCGMEWAVAYEPWGENRIIARLTIHGVTRASTGEADAMDVKNGMAGSVSEAMAFKRAAAMFGMGRYLYDLPTLWVEFDAQSKRISKDGQIELDRRYREWYMRATAAPATDSVAPSPAPAKRTSARPSTPHTRLWRQGQEVFSAEWDTARAWLLGKWTEKVTPANTRTSAAELTDEEKDLLADYLSANKETLQRVWAKQKIGMMPNGVVA